MKKIRKISNVLAVAGVSLFLFSVDTLAASYNFNGDLNYRLLDGSANNKYYSIGANKSITISGTVKKTGYNSSEVEQNAYGQKVGVQKTYINLYEVNNSGKGTAICSTNVSVSSGSKSFSASGTSKYSGKKYMYIYKPMNDGYDLNISGNISY